MTLKPRDGSEVTRRSYCQTVRAIVLTFARIPRHQGIADARAKERKDLLAVEERDIDRAASRSFNSLRAVFQKPLAVP
jgi:hypothetical protein